MVASPRRSSLTRQLVLPVVGLVLVAVLANVAFAAWLAARRAAAVGQAAQQRVAEALRSTRFALSPAVLEALERLTGSHFIVWDESTRRPGLSTLPREVVASLSAEQVAEAIAAGRGTFGGRRYRVGTTRSGSVRPEAVLVLTPERSVAAATLEAVWPVVAVAAATLAVLVPLGLRTTRRLAARIAAVEAHVEQIADGDFGHALDPGGTPAEDGDEIGRLVGGVNRLSLTLESLRGSLVSGERQRLLGQLAAGFAHELRNAVTGARLAIELHRRRCAAAAPADDGLAVAVRQLDILEEEVRGLLALGKGSAGEAAPAPLEVDRLLGEVRDLTAPRCDHAGVRLECAPAPGLAFTGRHDSLRAALVNLALNGIDAAGRGGTVRLSAAVADSRIVLGVEDSGAGPPEHLRTTMLDPFVTGKPEGIGLGLAVARAVAEEHGGTLDWERTDGRTRFAISLPTAQLESRSSGTRPGDSRTTIP
jgi:signal transduction histidine kinase